MKNLIQRKLRVDTYIISSKNTYCKKYKPIVKNTKSNKKVNGKKKKCRVGFSGCPDIPDIYIIYIYVIYIIYNIYIIYM